MANSTNSLNIKLAGIPVFDGVATFTESTTTQYNVLIGATSNAIANVAPSATSGVPLISQGSSSNPAFGTAVVGGGGTGATTLTAHGVLIGNGTSAISVTAVGTTGQVLTGVTGADPVWAAAGGGGLTWSEQTGTTQAMAVSHGYILNNAGLVTATLPATAAVGDLMEIVGKGAGGWRMAQNSGQTVHFGNQNTTTGATGSLSSTNRYDCISIICTTANTDFVVKSSIGNITVA